MNERFPSFFWFVEAFDCLLRWLFMGICLVLFAPVLAPFWLICRLKARRCPRCASRWRTELCGEWDGEEMWKCHACGRNWDVAYGTPRK